MVMMNVLDCTLVLGGLFRDNHFIKGMSARLMFATLSLNHFFILNNFEVVKRMACKLELN